MVHSFEGADVLGRARRLCLVLRVAHLENTQEELAVQAA